MNPKRDMSRIIPEILADRQTPILRIIRRDVRRVVVLAEIRGVDDPVLGRVVQDTREVGVGVEDHGFRARVRGGEGLGVVGDGCVVLGHHGCVWEGVRGDLGCGLRGGWGR